MPSLIADQRRSAASSGDPTMRKQKRHANEQQLTDETLLRAYIAHKHAADSGRA